MAEQTFRSPGFFEQEIDLSARVATPLGTPAGVVGTAERGPAFVPVSVGSLADFTARFGALDQDRFGPYAVREFLKNRNAVTYVRTLGAGVIENDTDISNAELGGFAKNAGIKLLPAARGGAANNGLHGAFTFIVAEHKLRQHGGGSEMAGYPIFTDNASYGFIGGDNHSGNPAVGSDIVNLVRAVILVDKGTRIIPAAVAADGKTAGAAAVEADLQAADSRRVNAHQTSGRFTLWIAQDANGENITTANAKAYVVSLDPNDSKYIAKVLNTDPDQFTSLKHMLYLDYAVEDELASLKRPGATANRVAVYIGSNNANSRTSSGYETGVNRAALYGRLDSRFKTARTPAIISQPFGETEYDLFHFETIDDGAIGNELYKVSIANVRRSNDPNNPYGTFDVQVRSFSDTDTNLEILEAYPACSLDPRSADYVAKKIGDKKLFYNFNAADQDDRGLAISGKNPNKSSRIRIIMSEAVEKREVPAESLPFGFRGVPTLKTSLSLMDTEDVPATHDAFFGEAAANNGDTGRDKSLLKGDNNVDDSDADLVFSIVPPLPFRFKCTRGAVSASPTWIGSKGDNERADSRLYWGVKFERMPVSSSADQGSVSDAVMNVNVGSLPNPLVSSYARFQGIAELDSLVTGSGADKFNNNKFTLARVAFANQADKSGVGKELSHLSGTAKEHMLEAAYIRSGSVDPVYYTIRDQGVAASDSSGGSQHRLTFASLVNHASSSIFNRFTEYTKFTTMFYGGFDGLNFLDRDNRLMNDKASSSDTGGKAIKGDPAVGLGDGTNNPMGDGNKNNVVASFKEAIDIITNPMASRVNILAVPGMRDAFISDHALEAVKKYSMAIYLMDVIKYASGGTRLYDGDTAKVDVQETAEQFESRTLDNNYGAAYFPDVSILDELNNEVVEVPASVVALSALGFNDRVAYPWFAPAGFNRGALENVTNVDVRLNSADRDLLYDARINPIAVFPTGGFVIFGQKTLQVAKSALDRVNVRRLLLEVKRLVSGVATKLLFEQNNAQTQQRFVNQVTPLLTLIQAQAGVEQFRVVCDATNNTDADKESNRMNGRIVLVPTRAVEFIAIDFVVTNSGVSFD